uniref:lytic cellulose monooxygenase (C4-dehydrogenating) n=1 Tax=Cytospora mali TaxID=578113 RepID=A0A455KZR4_CYTMA|nr:endo-1,4-beta-glucanase [Valsa mali]
MRSTFAGIAAFAACASAHYNFEALIVNDNVTSPYEYVRQTTDSNSPVTDVTSQDFICNQGGLDADIMAKTSTYTVKSGDQVGFTINSNIGHPGPLSVYMSKAPDGTSAKEYKGAGDWFKVYELSTSSVTSEGLQWATYVNGGINNFTFALPDSLPSGDYLMRAEHIALHGASTKGGAQFYLGCAQLTVDGSGSGTPSPTVNIPGVYDGTEPGILINIYYPVPTNYTAPGPVTWPNSCEDHTANFVEQTSDGDCTNDDSSSASGSSSSAAATGSAAASTTVAASTSAPIATSAGVAGNAASSSTAPAAASTATGSSSSSCKRRRALKEAKKGLSQL